MEEIIKRLESLRDICNARSDMAIGKGKIAWAGYANTADDAIALLKEQEAVRPTIGNADEYDGHSSWWYQCGKCKTPIDYKDKFCRFCGQAVKWQ